MWQLLKRLFSGPEPPPVQLDSEVMRFDEAGFTRSSHLIRSMGWRQSWRWDEITAFGFVFSPAMFPDPWFGDTMESQWFFTVKGETGPEHIYFDSVWLDIDHLPTALLQQMPGLDLDELKRGLNVAAVGFHNYEGEGRWIGWQRPKPKRRRKVAKVRAPAKTIKRESRAK
ncbi:hypothetical protein [Phyllobacterium zundukense]|uniref:hypothetical protein n=1 Tax=Phyllobacterium zundukense TaxID=1867719 RepID=UPI000C487481|nr:hypothetical protein [Phyllobacterium zundukense]ATU90569.1 hypothetical protein BLM14_02050 [Phyllobacterium zundukense]